MPLFKVKIQDGSNIDVPDNVELSLQGLRIIGDNKVDWNEPIQQNFMVLSNEIKDNKSEFDTLKTSVESSNTSSTEAITSMHTTLLLKANASDVYDRSTMDTFLDGKSDVSHSHANYASAEDVANIVAQLDAGAVTADISSLII